MPVKARSTMVRRAGLPCRYQTDCTSNLKDLTVDDQYMIKKEPRMGLMKNEISWRISDHYSLWTEFRLGQD